MATPPPNPDTRELPYGWTQQYNWEYRQWFYVNTRENPPRSSWEHPLGLVPQGYAPPPGPPPPDRAYSRSPYGGPPPPPQGYGGYPGYQPSYGSNAPPGGYGSGPGYGPGYPNRGYSASPQGGYRSEPQVVYVEEERKKKGPGWGTALMAGGAGLVGGALLTEAIESHDEHEREEGYEQGFQDGYDDGGGFF